jgi:hypothetical protein
MKGKIVILARACFQKNEYFAVLRTIKRRKADWIGHILRRNCLLQHLVEGKMEGTRRRRIRRKLLLDDLKQERRHWNLKDEALDCSL